MRLAFWLVILVVSAFTATTTTTTTSVMDKPWWNNTPDTVTWSSIASLPISVSRCAGASVGTRYYNIAGQTSSGGSYRAQMWDGASWTIIDSCGPGGEIFNISAAVVNGKIVISGGSQDTGYLDYTSVLNPAIGTGIWMLSTKCALTSVENPLYVGLGAKCYWFGGIRDDITTLSCVYEWTPGDVAMTLKGSMPSARSYLMGAEYNNRIYLFGGSSSPAYGTPTNTIWQYTPSTNTWVTKSATLSQNRCWGNAVTISDKIYIIGGYTAGGVTNMVEVYNPVTDTITTASPMTFATRSGGAGGVTNPSSNHTYSGTIIVAGGWNGSAIIGTANKGTVIATYTEVAPASLGNIKAAYR